MDKMKHHKITIIIEILKKKIFFYVLICPLARTIKSAADFTLYV